MKTPETVLDVQSTLAGEKVEMTLDPAAAAHLMEVLTKLYADPELAVIREYSTNAMDSHIQAGQTRPIEVTLPSAFAPFFTVRDFGIGLDAEDIRDIYSRYGVSTKRNSNEVVGMLGLGCKSALAYTQSFTLTGIKDGNAIQVQVTRSKDGGGEMNILAEYETDEDDGVEIVIPVAKFNRIEQKANNFFSFWKEGTVLVNGEQPKPIDGFRIADDLMVVEGRDNYVVMGNVPYPVSSAYPWNDGLNWNYGRVAWVEIGEVNFSPSRESLMETPQTTKTLDALNVRFKEARAGAIQRLVDEAPTKPEALTLLGKLRAAWQSKENVFHYKGELIPTEFEAPFTISKDTKGKVLETKVYDWKFVTGNAKTGYGTNRTNRSATMPTSVFASHTWMVGFTAEDLTPYKKRKLIQWQSKQEGVTGPYIFVPEIPKDMLSWIDPSTIYHWANVEAEKLATAGTKGTSGKLSGSFVAFVNGEFKRELALADVDQTKPVLYKEGTKATAAALQDRWDSTIGSLNAVVKEYTLLIVGANRLEKFKRDMPKATTVNEHLKIAADKWASKLTDDAKTLLAYKDDNTFGLLNQLDASKVHNAELQRLITLQKEKKNHTSLESAHYFRHYTTVELPAADEFDKYPLLTQLSHYGTLTDETKNHLYLYLNAVHSA